MGIQSYRQLFKAIQKEDKFYKQTVCKTGAMGADWACSLFQCTVHSTFDPGIPKILNRGPALFQHQIMDANMDQLPKVEKIYEEQDDISGDTYLLFRVLFLSVTK